MHLVDRYLGHILGTSLCYLPLGQDMKHLQGQGGQEGGELILAMDLYWTCEVKCNVKCKVKCLTGTDSGAAD